MSARWKLVAAACAALLLLGGPASGQEPPSAAVTGTVPTPRGEQGGDWASIARLPPLAGVWMIARGPGLPPGRRGAPPPLNEIYAARLKAYTGQDSQTANCIPPGMPQIMDAPFPIEPWFAPGKILLVHEGYMQVRHIHTDGRKHPEDPDLSFNGHSIGWWEDDTLVVDTIGLVPQVELEDGVPHGTDLRIVERFRLVDPNTLEVQTTVTDPLVLAKPWEYATRYTRSDYEITEYVCQQNNRESVDAEGRMGIRLQD